MFYKKEQKKNIISGYLYILGAICFVVLMFFLIIEAGGESVNRIYVELFVVFAIGIACIFTGVKQIIDYKTYLEGIPKPMLDELSTQLELFKSLDISVRDITHCINKDKEKYFVNNPVIVHTDDVVEALEKIRANKVSSKEFLVWCNLITFSDCYHFDPDRMDEIESVIMDIHRKMEINGELSLDQIDAYIQALYNHTEI